MISVRDLFKAGTQMANSNAPAILTAFGAVGTVATAVLTAKATFEAAEKISEHEGAANAKRDAGDPRVVFTKAERIKLVWPLYISAVSTGTLSCAAIILAHRVSSRRAAALAAAYALNEGRLEEYQEKIKEKFGVKKEEEARVELTQQKINRDYEGSEVVLNEDDNLVLIREDYTGRFFKSTIDRVNKAVNEINHNINMEGSARLSDFYDCIGLSHVSTSDYFGFTHDDRLELDWSTCTTPDGSTPVHSFEYVNHPVMNPEAGVRPFR